MKKICMSLFFTLISMTTFPYKITNSPASSIKVIVALTKGSISDNIRNKATYRLEPGDSGAWNQHEIRNKLKVNNLTGWVFKGDMREWNEQPLFRIDKMPVSANLEILVEGELGGRIAGGAVDLSTGEVYNLIGLDEAAQLIKRYKPQKLPSISTILQRAHIK